MHIVTIIILGKSKGIALAYILNNKPKPVIDIELYVFMSKIPTKIKIL